ncbi:MAG: glycerol-3-phosphate dehydrogenase/oxidase [Desulfosudis oleivorans]|nr:glycerol-3-phosphate dehydrogenase/oxidase [Desulfosudis oleivorans]
MQYDWRQPLPGAADAGLHQVRHGGQTRAPGWPITPRSEQFPAGGRTGAAAWLAKDLVRGGSVEIKAKLTVNCGGPWADIVLGPALRAATPSKELRRSGGHPRGRPQTPRQTT